MRFIQTLLAGTAIVASALAATVELNDWPSNVQAGHTYTIKYSPKDNTPTTLTLRKGTSTDLKDVAVITTDATGGVYTWKVADDLPSGSDYALQIKRPDGNNYSGLFVLVGTNGPVSSSASASASASASSAISSAISSALSSASSASSKSSESASKSASSHSTVTSKTSASASASASSSAGSNTTISTATLSRTGTSSSGPTGTTSSTGGGAPKATGAASTIVSSPLALILGAVAAMAYLN